MTASLTLVVLMAVLFIPWIPMPRCTAIGSTIFSKLRYDGSAAFSGMRIVSYLS